MPPAEPAVAPLISGTYGNDLNGDGIQLVQVANSQANFDLNADGVRERVGWIGPNDGYLALVADGDGKILGLRGTMLHDTGAYLPWGIITPFISATYGSRVPKSVVSVITGPA